MMKERDLIDFPVLYVEIGEAAYLYQMVYTKQGFSTYVPPPDKNVIDGINIDEIIFLPISREDFKNHQDEYFFGMRYLFSYSNHLTVDFLENPMAVPITTLQLQYEVSRFRYYPSKEKTIVIDKQYDCLYPTIPLSLQCQTSHVNMELINAMGQLTDMYCGYYHDKKI